MTTDCLLMLDLDGTLIDTSQLYFQGVPPIVARYLGIAIGKEDLLPMWGQFARNYFAHFARKVGRDDDRLIDSMYAEFSQYYNEMHNELSHPYEGVCELLPAMREAVRAVVVVTTRPASRSAPVLEMSWAGDVDDFVWGDQIGHMKPSPDGIEEAIRRHGGGSSRYVYVGDNPHDVEAAQVAFPKTISVAALWDAMDRERLLAARPDISFETFRDLSNWVLRGCPYTSPRGT